MHSLANKHGFPTVTLLNIPGFIERLCKLATRKVSEATGANFLQELEEWYTWLDNALVLDALMQMATEEAEQSSTGEAKVIYDAAHSSGWIPWNFYSCIRIFVSHLQSPQMRVLWPPALWDIGYPSPWRLSMRSCIKWKYSMCSASFWWADKGIR